MKITAQRTNLLNGLQAVANVVERRQTMPILSNLLLKAEGGELTLTATDLELELVTRVPVEVVQAGAITVPARKLLDICRGLPEAAEIALELVEGRAQLRSGRSRFALATLPAAEFPYLDRIDDGDAVEVSQATLKRLLDRTHFAMAHQDVRYYLNGLLLVVQPARLRAVATDGHRLALSEAEAQTGVEAARQVIVPRKAVMELLRVLEAGDAPISLVLTPNHLQIELPKLRFTSKLVDGRFPDYDRVIPEPSETAVCGDRKLLHQALSRTAILSNEKFKGVRLSLAPGQLRLQAQNPDHEEAEDEIEVEYQGAPVEIGFNVTYLMDALSAMQAEQFTLDLSGPDSSGLLREKGDASSRFVVMPMRL